MVIADPRPDVVPEVLDETVYASWTARVVATVLDGLAFSGLGYLVAGPALDVDVIPPVTFGTDTSSMSDVAPGARAFLVAVVVLVLLLQGYGGATPGKRVVGIAVVDDQTGRPVGLVRTVLRSFAHLLDAILLIGYLRPLWNAERRTFADSIVGTVVLRTRTVRSNLALEGLVSRRGSLRTGRSGARGSLGEPATPGWEARTTAVAAVVTVGLALFSGSWSSWGASGASAERCSFPVLDSGTFTPTGATLSADDSVSTERRFWVESTTTQPATEVAARWQWVRTVPEGATVQLVATSADGTRDTRTVAELPVATPTDTVVDGAVVGEVTVDVSTLGPGWVAQTSISVDGSQLATCAMTDPLA